jgi:hypothetical protein
MRLVSTNSHHATVCLSRSESALIGNVLNEFINGIDITEDELVLRLGYGRSLLRPLHDQFADKHRSVWPDDSSSSPTDSTEVSVQLTHTQLEIINGALKDLAGDKDIEVWEFPIRLGQAPEEALKLAGQLDAVVKSWPTQ